MILLSIRKTYKKEVHILKKILALFAAFIIATMGLSAPAFAAGSDGPTPYTVDANGVTLPSGETFKAHGHVNIKYKVGNTEYSKGIHFDPNNNQPGGAWIGKSNIPWSAFAVPANGCVTWVQVHGYNEHFGEGGQTPVCLGTPKPDPDPADSNKKIEVCHYNGGDKVYSKIEVNINSFVGNGHISHNRDIWKAFSYVTKGGQTVHVPSQGDTDLLAFDDCAKPPVDQEIVVPAVTHVDKCEKANDTVTPVRDDAKYTTVVGDRVGDSITVTFTAKDGFVFPGGKKVVKVTVDFPNNDDCDLPETGGDAKYNVNMGIGAVAMLLLGAGAFLLIRRKA